MVLWSACSWMNYFVFGPLYSAYNVVSKHVYIRDVVSTDLRCN